MQRLGAWLGLAWLMGLSVGCGPVYKTVYAFDPPRDAAGRRCIVQCDTQRQQCQELEALKSERCRAEARIAELEYEQCQANAKDPKRCSRRYVSCDHGDIARCESAYRICYQNCGGSVRSKTVCTAHCDKAK